MEIFQPQKELATHLMAGSQRKMAGQKLSRQHHLQPRPNTKSMRVGRLINTLLPQTQTAEQSQQQMVGQLQAAAQPQLNK